LFFGATDAPVHLMSYPAAAGADPSDVINLVAELSSTGPARQIRQLRAKVAQATQACDELIFSPTLAAGLSLHERLQAAQAAAQAAELAPLATHYHHRLEALAVPAQASARLQAILDFSRSVSLRPLSADRLALRRLQDQGLTVPDIVLLAQLVGYVAYQLRLIAGLRVLDALEPESIGSACPAQAPSEAFVHPAHLPPPGTVLNIAGYTNASLDWQAWLPVVDLQQTSPSQQAVLDNSHPKARSSDFYRLLAHQPEVLAQRSSAFNAIMYAPGGLARAERELATAAVSRANGCVYCLSVHAQRFEQLSKRNDVIAQLFAEPGSAGSTPRERALIQFALALTERPAALRDADLLGLRAAGLSDLELLDALHASALFAWANRLMLNLGEAVEPAAPSATGEQA
jgi:uncharacterized peroxidase-related enzyme